VWDGVYSSAQVARGKTAYANLCARCHGETLLGNDDAVPLVGAEFVKRWEGKSIGAMVDLTQKDMPTDGPGKLTRRQVTDVTVFVLNANGYPAGQNEMPAELETLNAILIQPKK
jgi:mono/diheme cytochrome c family protein